MRAARVSLLLAAAAMLVCGLHLTLALPAEVAEAKPEAAAEAVSQRDPDEHATEHDEEPAAPAYHFPRPSEIIHAVGNYVHGAHQQHVQEHHEEHHEHHHRPTHRPTTHRPPHRPLGHREKIKATKTVLVEVSWTHPFGRRLLQTAFVVESVERNVPLTSAATVALIR